MCHYSGGFGYAPHGSQSGMIVMRRRKRETLSAAVRSKPITDKQTPLDPYIHLDRLIRFSSSSSTSCSGRDETVCLTGPSGPTPRCAEQNKVATENLSDDLKLRRKSVLPGLVDLSPGHCGKGRAAFHRVACDFDLVLLATGRCDRGSKFWCPVATEEAIAESINVDSVTIHACESESSVAKETSAWCANTSCDAAVLPLALSTCSSEQQERCSEEVAFSRPGLSCALRCRPWHMWSHSAGARLH